MYGSGEHLLMTKAKARLQLGRKAIRVHNRMFESKWIIWMR